MKGHTMKCTFEHRECSVFFSSSALAHCRCLVSITASLKLNQGGSSKVSVETKTKPNQTSAPQIEPGGGLVEGCRRNQNQTCIPPTNQPQGSIFTKASKIFCRKKNIFPSGELWVQWLLRVWLPLETYTSLTFLCLRHSTHEQPQKKQMTKMNAKFPNNSHCGLP